MTTPGPVMDNLCLNITATFFKLEELTKVLSIAGHERVLAMAMNITAPLNEDEQDALMLALRHQHKQLAERLRRELQTLVVMMDQEGSA